MVLRLCPSRPSDAQAVWPSTGIHSWTCFPVVVTEDRQRTEDLDILGSYIFVYFCLFFLENIYSYILLMNWNGGGFPVGQESRGSGEWCTDGRAKRVVFSNSGRIGLGYWKNFGFGSGSGSGIGTVFLFLFLFFNRVLSDNENDSLIFGYINKPFMFSKLGWMFGGWLSKKLLEVWNNYLE